MRGVHGRGDAPLIVGQADDLEEAKRLARCHLENGEEYGIALGGAGEKRTGRGQERGTLARGIRNPKPIFGRKWSYESHYTRRGSSGSIPSSFKPQRTISPQALLNCGLAARRIV